MQILVFTKNGNNIPIIPDRPGLIYRIIDFNTNKLEELLLIAKFRIINFPTWLLINKQGKILLKVREPIPDSYVQRYIN